MSIKMATKIIKQEAYSLTVEINNGDLEALQNIKKKWHFKDLESVLRFSLAVLTISENGKLFHEKENGKTERFIPMDDLIEKA